MFSNSGNKSITWVFVMVSDSKTAGIGVLTISKHTIKKLTDASISSIDELTLLCERELIAIRGIGQKTVDEIMQALSLSGLELAKDRYGKLVCARHNKKRNDTRIKGYFLCAGCASEFQVKAFNNQTPTFTMGVTGGPYFCSHCNNEMDVSLYQWYVCDVCDRVVRSISRSIAANIGVGKWWEECRTNDLTLPTIEDIDSPTLRPTGKGIKEAKLDFVWRNDFNDIIFGTEIKTGRNHLSGGSIGAGMSRFQLDVSDIEDIIKAMDASDPFIPAYVFHCQVVDLPFPPTSQFECVGIWWTSISSLIENILEIKNRPREIRPAAYINTKTFHEIASFVDEEIRSKNYSNCPNPKYLQRDLDAKKPKSS